MKEKYKATDEICHKEDILEHISVRLDSVSKRMQVPFRNFEDGNVTMKDAIEIVLAVGAIFGTCQLVLQYIG